MLVDWPPEAPVTTSVLLYNIRLLQSINEVSSPPKGRHCVRIGAVTSILNLLTDYCALDGSPQEAILRNRYAFRRERHTCSVT